MLILALTCATVSAQTLRLRGIVVDSISGDPIPYASVAEADTQSGTTLTDDNGNFWLTIPTAPVIAIQATAMGYSNASIQLTPKQATRKITIRLAPTGVQLGVVTAKPRKEKYSKHHNPALEFMEKIRQRADLTDPRRHDDYNYDKYERISVALNHFNPSDTSANSPTWLLRRFPSLRNNIDRSETNHDLILHLISREKASQIHYRRTPADEREIIQGIQSAGIDQFIDRENLERMYRDVLREVDVYQNDIPILQNRFVSPLSRIAPDFYKYYLTDTVTLDTVKCAVLTFVPHNPKSMGFTGRFYVPLADSTMMIKRIYMSLPHGSNVNFIDAIHITQDYHRAPDGSRLKTHDDMIVEASLIPGLPSLYVKRSTNYANHNFTPSPESFTGLGKLQTTQNAYHRDQTFWQSHRLSQMSNGEKSVAAMMKQLQANKLYYWSEKVIGILVDNNIPLGKKSKFDLGPIDNFLSFNDVEGLRLFAGGMTTANLSKRLFSRAYIAHGFKDHRWKYKAEAEWSFHDKTYHSREFPIHSLRLTHLYDTDWLGKSGNGNIFTSFQRQSNYRVTYHRLTQLDYTLELENNLSVVASVWSNRQIATPTMPFVNGHGTRFTHLTQTAASLTLRYAPGEKFYQTKSQRQPINKDAPTITLSQTIAPKGTLGNKFTLNKTELSFEKRFWFSAFGYIDMRLSAAHIWSRVNYPDLIIPSSNLSYTIQEWSFSMLNPMEFITDTYAGWNVNYWTNGAIFNHIPLLKRLRLREVFGFKGFFGRLSPHNNPAIDKHVMQFPTDAKISLINPHVPYMEASVGISNILRLLRVDFVWRLTYRDLPDVPRGGLRVGVHLTF